MDAYLIACFVAIIALALSNFFTNYRLDKLDKEVQELRNEVNK